MASILKSSATLSFFTAFMVTGTMILVDLIQNKGISTSPENTPTNTSMVPANYSATMQSTDSAALPATLLFLSGLLEVAAKKTFVGPATVAATTYAASKAYIFDPLFAAYNACFNRENVGSATHRNEASGYSRLQDPSEP